MAALTTTGQPAAGELRVIEPTTIDERRWLPVPGCPGVMEKELWDAGDLVSALIRYEPGARTPGHPHLVADHHIWVVAGTATIGDRRMVAGSYVHVPRTAAHPIEAGPVGCTILQLHHRNPAG